ncbi:MAG TPA: MarR family transcriptional regulator [Gemmatimonadaceae bacterium]|nr:MarR family transcriptional regulator [Gemmatimonadaceae bacterium]
MTIRDRVRQTRFPSPAAAAWVGLVVAADHVTSFTDTVCARHGITGDQYNVLRILRGARTDGLARGEITARLARRAPDMTRMLDRLERGHLVRRVRGADDARRSVARITPAGLRLLERLDPEIETAMATATVALTRAELRQLWELCDKLVS